MKLWEYRIKQYTYSLEDKNIQKEVDKIMKLKKF